jgi:dTMP kinase
VPDLTILLDVDPVLSKARRERDAARTGDDRLESLPDDFHARVRARFLDLARREPHRYLVIDAGLSVEEIHELARGRVRDVLPISARRRAELKERLTEEEQSRERRAAAEAEVLRMDADLRTKRISEARLREESRRKAREEAEHQLQEEAERELRAQEGRRNRDEAERRSAAAAAAAVAAVAPVEPVTERLPIVDAFGGNEVETIGRAAEAVSRAAAPASATAQLPSVPPAAPTSAAERAAAAVLAEPEPRSDQEQDGDVETRRGRHR